LQQQTVVTTTVRDPDSEQPAEVQPGGLLARLFAGSTYRFEVADESAFMSRRVRLYLAVLFWFFGFFTVAVGVKGWIFVGDPALARAAGIATAVMAAVTAFFGVGWLRHRDPCSCSRQSMQLYEAIGTVLASIAVGAIALVVPADVPLWNLPFTIVLALVLRAAIIPSTASRSVVVGALSTAAMTVPVWLAMRGHAEGFDRLVWLAVASWGIIFTIATAIVSRVIYGLQRSVRRAMQLGNYTLERKIGEGGMGVVYLARHALLRRPTAVKLLRPDRIGERSVARFEREVQQTSRLEHPNIVVIYDYGRTPDSQFYYAMEYLDGLTLDELVDQGGPVPPGRVIYILAQVAHALADAHANGLIHRDVKPANVVLCNRGGVADLAKVVDFGLVKELENGAAGGASMTNVLTGTPLYMAPESITDPTAVDGRADLYALGAIGYFLLTGTHLFSGSSVVEICAQHLHSQPDDPATRLGAPLPDDLVAVLLRCLAKDPADRFPDALAMRGALLACRSAARWTLADAVSWWERTGDAVDRRHRRSSVPVTTANATLAVARTLPDSQHPHAV
jgi:serine/threonine-protein kinase